MTPSAAPAARFEAASEGLPGPTTSDVLDDLGDGIVAIDTGFQRPRFDAAYLIAERGRGAFVDVGINSGLPRLLAALDAARVARDAVDFVIVTHVHLDHAGAAGQLMRHLPNARLVVHPHGAQHLIDPGRLLASAAGVYGAEAVRRTYGDVIGVDAARILKSDDAMTLDLAGRPLRLFDTPGHARHHHAVWDARSRSVFTGDAFGLSYREFDGPHGAWAMPTTTPVQFEPAAMRHSIDRIVGFEPRWICLTHYGRVGDAPRLADLLRGQLDAMVALAQSLPVDGGRDGAPRPGDAAARQRRLRDGLLRIHAASLRAHGCTWAEARIAEWLALDIELNAQGIAVWLDRARRGRPCEPMPDAAAPTAARTAAHPTPSPHPDRNCA